ncbi:hypothetical protein AYK25_07995 [Thermoplasmatales archaeon SM1-50]|nr:MAG: hypothetical protein AYK25_07995 [Thermoplasmatales archaeon SM1-50]
MTESELYLPLSMELGWLSTKEAQQFVKYAIKQGLLIRKDEELTPSFPLEKVSIPLGFTPSKKLFKEQPYTEEEGVIERITFAISTHTHRNLKDVQEEIKKEQKEKNLLPEVAALYVARKHHVDITNWYTSIEQYIFQRK